MRFVIAMLLCTLAYCAGGYAAPTAAGGRAAGLDIRIEGGGWGGAARDQIETVLYAVADVLLPRPPQKLSAPILVSHTHTNPVALYERGPGGEYLVHLHASGTRWHLYAYEFAHELCHIMSNFEHNVGTDSGKHNQWFEESLCETASLFTLTTLAATWEACPPAPEWSEQAPKLRRFADQLVREDHRRLSPRTPLAAWLQDNAQRLSADPYQRDKNELVANLMLPLFQRQPENWDALCYLNLDPADARNDLQQYLRNWYHNAPAQHREFIAGVLDLLGVAGAAPASTAALEATHVPSPGAAVPVAASAGQAARIGR